MTNYVLIEPAYEDDAARFGSMLNYDDRFELREGIPLSDTIPPDAAYRMSDDFPDRVALHDVLHNLDRQLIVNEKARAFLEAESVRHVEYLPIKVLNHKDRVVNERYFVVNMFPLVDCIDLTQTQYKRNRLDPEKLMHISNLTVHEDKIPADFQLLRLKSAASVVLIHRDLAARMKAAGIRGFSTPEVSEYRGN